MIRTKVMWLEQAAPQWEEVVEQDAARCDALRLAELAEWQRETGKRLPMPVEMIMWFETCGYVVDLLTGEATLLEPLQEMIDEGDAVGEHEDGSEDAYWRGMGDQAAGCYDPPRGNIEAHDAYIRGHNDAWAKSQKVNWWRRSERRGR